MSAPDTSYCAAIDLGSNSFHLLIARYLHGKLTVLIRDKATVQIARGMQDDGKLTPDACQRALDCLQSFALQLQQYPGIVVRAAGTKALRDASNANVFIEQAQQVLGHSVDVLSGEEEARLVYGAATRDYFHRHYDTHQPSHFLVIDIGGGSTELVIGQGDKPRDVKSLDIGCVSYAEQFFPLSSPDSAPHTATVTADRMNLARLATSKALDKLPDVFFQNSWHTAIGASSSIGLIAKLLPQHCRQGIITTVDID